MTHSSGFALPSATPWTPRERAENARLARFSTEAPLTPWNDFLRIITPSAPDGWKAGEHVALVGPTGQGKTTMMNALLPLHPYVVAFATKPRDESMERLIEQGYVRIPKWNPGVPARRMPRRVLWPSARKLDSKDLQRAVFRDAMERIYIEGAWTVAIDELWVFSQQLNMDDYVKMYLFQARSLGISLFAATQRPVDVPLALYDQSTHLMFYRDNDEANLKRLAGISYRSGELIRDLVANLARYQVLYVNTRTGRMLRTRAPAPRPLNTSKGG